MKTTYTNEELKTMDENHGITELEMFYTGGGIYCFIGKLDEKVYICGSSECYVVFVNERPDEEFGGCDWEDEHAIFYPTLEESVEWTYGTIALFIDRVKNGMMDEILPTSNYSLSELEKILERLSKGLCPIGHTEPECIQATDQEMTKGMKNLRIIEITDGCMGGESTLYLTDCPTETIKKACNLYAKDDDQSGFNEIEKHFAFKVLISTCEMLFVSYQEAKEHFNITETISIF